MGYYMDQLAEQDRQRRLADLLAMQQDNIDPGVQYDTGVPDQRQQFLSALADPNNTIRTSGFNENFMRGEPYMPPQQSAPMPQNYIRNERTGAVTDLGQSQPSRPIGDMSQVSVDTPYGRGYYMKGDNTKVVLGDGRIADLGRDTTKERALTKENLALDKTRAEIANLTAKQVDTGSWDTVESNGKQYLINKKTGQIKPAEIGGEQLAGKSTEKPMTAAQRANFEKGFANDYQTVNQTVETMSNIKNAIEAIKGSKGLEAREGLTGYIPSVMQGENARTAQNRIDTLKGKVTQMGKAMASMAGAIGPMAVQEWKIVSDAVNAIDPTAGNFQEQLQNIESQADGAITRIKDKYDRQYVDRFDKYPQFRRGEGGEKPPGGEQTKTAIPDSAAAYLRNNPSLRGQFDAKYGVGASAQILGQ